MTIPGTVDKASSASGRSNANSKSPSKTIQIKKPGITVKRKPSSPASAAASPSPMIPAKKSKKSPSSNGNSNKSTSKPASTVVSFDLEATLCPICDEACTCPKTAPVIVKSPTAKKSSTETSPKKQGVNTKKAPAKKKTAPVSRKDKPKFVKRHEISDDESDDYYEEEEDSYDEQSTTGQTSAVEDPALSFIRMIYSDEESLDEEEAYALYQATQLFSSSSDEAEYSEDDYGSDAESDSSDDEGFEYTVVEYVQPSLKKLAKKNTEFIAYESGDDSDSEGEQANLLLNTEKQDASDSESLSSNSSSSSEFSENESNWLTYSVFDVDRDLIVGGGSSSATCTSLSSHGSGTPDTLLFSTSSTDKIPNIAPQVLAAISAAAKHMANQRSDPSTGSSSSKYFSYITLKDPLRTEEVNEEEFLFFEEGDPINENDSDDCSSISSCEEDEISSEFESFSDCSSNESVTEIIVSEKQEKKKPIPPVSANLEYINRWNRVPIGAFRRSRRPSIPSFHHIHPSTALKSFSTDPANFTLAATTGTSNNNNEDSFDEGSASTAPQERAYSVITWDELDLDIATPVPTNSSLSSHSSSPTSSNTHCPLPKRSRSVMLPVNTSSNSLVNNFEWLNSNWNWEI